MLIILIALYFNYKMFTLQSWFVFKDRIRFVSGLGGNNGLNWHNVIENKCKIRFLSINVKSGSYPFYIVSMGGLVKFWSFPFRLWISDHNDSPSTDQGLPTDRMNIKNSHWSAWTSIHSVAKRVLFHRQKRVYTDFQELVSKSLLLSRDLTWNCNSSHYKIDCKLYLKKRVKRSSVYNLDFDCADLLILIVLTCWN